MLCIVQVQARTGSTQGDCIHISGSCGEPNNDISLVALLLPHCLVSALPTPVGETIYHDAPDMQLSMRDPVPLTDGVLVVAIISFAGQRSEHGQVYRGTSCRVRGQCVPGRPLDPFRNYVYVDIASGDGQSGLVPAIILTQYGTLPAYVITCERLYRVDGYTGNGMLLLHTRQGVYLYYNEDMLPLDFAWEVHCVQSTSERRYRAAAPPEDCHLEFAILMAIVRKACTHTDTGRAAPSTVELADALRQIHSVEWCTGRKLSIDGDVYWRFFCRA